MKIAGLTVFLCQRRPGNLRLTPSACASSHKMAKGADDVDKVRLWYCADCPTGAQNLAELGTAKPGTAKAGKAKELPEQMRNLLKFLSTRGQATTAEAASHFARHRGPVHNQLSAMQGKGLVRRVERDGQLAWEAAL